METREQHPSMDGYWRVSVDGCCEKYSVNTSQESMTTLLRVSNESAFGVVVETEDRASTRIIVGNDHVLWSDGKVSRGQPNAMEWSWFATSPDLVHTWSSKHGWKEQRIDLSLSYDLLRLCAEHTVTPEFGQRVWSLCERLPFSQP